MVSNQPQFPSKNLPQKPDQFQGKRASIRGIPLKTIEEYSKEITIFLEDEELRLMSLPTIRGIIEAATNLSLRANIKLVHESRNRIP